MFSGIQRFLTTLRGLVEKDLTKMMGTPVKNPRLWSCMFADFVLIQLFLGPCNVLIWRGGWNLYDYLFGVDEKTHHPNHLGPEAVPLFLGGLVLSIPVIFFSSNISDFAKDLLGSHPRPRRSFRYIYVSRLYSVVSFIVMLLFWKGWFDIWLDIPDFPHHWQFSLSCFVLGSLILLYIGCLKSAALSSPMGLWLDTADRYMQVDQFFPADDKEDTLGFRLINSIMTLVMEVLSLITYYGSYSFVYDIVEVGWIFKSRLSIGERSVIFIVIATVSSFICYVASILYLYLHYEIAPKVRYVDGRVLDCLYGLVLILSTFSTSLHFHAWWEAGDYLKDELFGLEGQLWPELVGLCLGFFLTILLGVGSGNHFGVIWESEREKEGCILPFFYLTYIKRDEGEEGVENPVGELVLDVIFPQDCSGSHNVSDIINSNQIDSN